MRGYISLFLCFLFVGGFVFAQAYNPAYAQNEADQIEAQIPDNEEEIIEVDEEAQNEREAAVIKANKMIMAILTLAKEDQKSHFMYMYTNYNMIRAVEIVQEDVEKAVQSCGENNPDMKSEMNSRFEEWDSEIEPIKKEAKVNLNNMILAQDYATENAIEDIFTHAEIARDLTENQIEKIPVTTPEACEFLLNKMNDTQNDLLTLLRQTLTSHARMFKKAEAAEETESADQENGIAQETGNTNGSAVDSDTGYTDEVEEPAEKTFILENE